MKRHPHQIVWEARQIAEAHHLFIVEVRDKVGDEYYTAYVVYRRNPEGGRGTRIGKRRNPSALLHLVRTCAGVAA